MVAKINRIILFFYTFILIAGLAIKPAIAESITLISDAETQNYLADVVKPLYNAAGLSFDAKKLHIVNDTSLNAFVSDGNEMFINSGTIIAADNSNEISGILAHETGHILGGHIVRQKLKLEKMQYVMLASMLAAGATAVSSGRGDAAVAVLLGSQSSALNNLLHYQVQEERSADESAVKLLNKTKQSTAGLLRFMNKIKKKNILSGIEESNYFNNHPLTGERIAHFAEVSKSNHYNEKTPLDKKFDLVKAKLAAFLLNEKYISRLYPLNDTSQAAKYAHCISNFRQGNILKALETINVLIKEAPQNPCFYELKGQILFESGKVNESKEAFQQALKLLPQNNLLKISLAHAILESSQKPESIQQAINLLQQALIYENIPFAWQLLSRAYDISGNKAYSYYAAAEFSYALDNLETAKSQLHAAKKYNPSKSLNLKISDLEKRIEHELNENSRTY